MINVIHNPCDSIATSVLFTSKKRSIGFGNIKQSNETHEVNSRISDSRKSSVESRLESIMLQNLLIMLFGISPIFCLLCSFLCFLGMHYADNLYL